MHVPPPASPLRMQDLWQYPDREQWYLPKFAADDQARVGGWRAGGAMAAATPWAQHSPSPFCVALPADTAPRVPALLCCHLTARLEPRALCALPRRGPWPARGAPGRGARERPVGQACCQLSCRGQAPHGGAASRQHPHARGRPCPQVTLEVEASRERVPLRNAYRHVGQRARVRVNSGAEQASLERGARARGASGTPRALVHRAGGGGEEEAAVVTSVRCCCRQPAAAAAMASDAASP